MGSMNSDGRTIHLCAFLQSVGHLPSAWRHPSTNPEGVDGLEHWAHLANVAERGLFDAVFIADQLAVGEFGIRLDPAAIACALVGRTSHVGLMFTASTTYFEPYDVARTVASLDHLSGGRAGWNVVAGFNLPEAQNFGRDTLLDHDERYRRAEEFITVVERLWGSYDADVLDRDSGVRFDPSSRAPEINHVGEFFSVRGPLTCPYPPQRRPVIVQAGQSEAGMAFAARHADMVFAVQETLEQAQSFYGALKADVARAGRNPDEVMVMPGFCPIVGGTEEEAHALKAEIDAVTDITATLGVLSRSAGVDLSAYDLDGPVPPPGPAQKAQGGRVMDITKLAEREGLTIRQLCLRWQMVTHHVAVGAPEQIADAMEERFLQRGADAFNIRCPLLPGNLEAFVEHVVPILQRRGLYRTEYSGTTLRDHLGLPTPTARYGHRASGAVGPPGSGSPVVSIE